jgi:hypothetical protein
MELGRRPDYDRISMSDATVKVSVLIPTYNEAATIRKVVRTVRAVSVPGVVLEIVVVDDGSTDGTRDICRTELADEIDVYAEQPQNRGKGAALRRALEVATGEIVLVRMQTWSTRQANTRSCSPRSWKTRRTPCSAHASRAVTPTAWSISGTWSATVS